MAVHFMVVLLAKKDKKIKKPWPWPDNYTLKLEELISGIINIKSGGTFSFGARTTLDTVSGTLAAESIYQVQSDGFLTAFHSAKQIIDARILSDSSNPPTTVIARSISDNGGHNHPITVPIRKDDYWKATKGIRNLDTIFWVPIGTGGCVKQ